MIRYGSVCSGIAAESYAWRALGWRTQFFAEIADFPSRVLAYHYPEVPNRGDFTSIDVDDVEPVDVLFGGTPCQSFSLSGLRGGLRDPRGALALQFFRLARRLRPRWIVWENVAGSVHADDGRAFGSILGAMGELGYGWAYRVLDARHFGIAQRRRRVFLVGHASGFAGGAAAVLFEPPGLRGDPVESSDEIDRGEEAPRRACEGPSDRRVEVIPFDEVQITHPENRSKPRPGDPAPTPNRSAKASVAISFYSTGSKDPTFHGRDLALPLKVGSGTTASPLAIARGAEVRRLTPIEYERLFGFPDDYTKIPGASDTARYQALGNSAPTTVLEWIGRRLEVADAALEAARLA